LQRELAYVQYINPIAVLCLEVYELDIPLLQTSEVRTAVCGLSLLDRDYKKVIFGSRIAKLAFDSFIKSVIDAFIAKYCQA
jgi:hypothetical protein